MKARAPAPCRAPPAGRPPTPGSSSTVCHASSASGWLDPFADEAFVVGDDVVVRFAEPCPYAPVNHGIALKSPRHVEQILPAAMRRVGGDDPFVLGSTRSHHESAPSRGIRAVADDVIRVAIDGAVDCAAYGGRVRRRSRVSSRSSVRQSDTTQGLGAFTRLGTHRDDSSRDAMPIDPPRPRYEQPQVRRWIASERTVAGGGPYVPPTTARTATIADKTASSDAVDRPCVAQIHREPSDEVFPCRGSPSRTQVHRPPPIRWWTRATAAGRVGACGRPASSGSVPAHRRSWRFARSPGNEICAADQHAPDHAQQAV